MSSDPTLPDIPVPPPAGGARPDLKPPPLVMPADEYAIVTGAWRDWLDSPLKAALEQAIADAVAAERARAEAAAVKLAAIEALCRDRCSYAITRSTSEAIVQVPEILAIVGTGKEPS